MSYGVDVHPYYQRGYGFDGPTPDFAWVKGADGSRPYRGVYDGVPWAPDILVARAKARGVPVGLYLYGQPVSRSGVSFAASTDVLLAEVDRVGADGVMPALDIEDDIEQHIWSAAEARDFIGQFVARCHARGWARPFVYMNDAMAAKVGRPFLDSLQDVGLWIARYAKDGVTRLRPVNTRYDVHQWTSAGGLDKNEAFNDRHLTRSAGGGSAPGSADITEQEEIDMITLPASEKDTTVSIPLPGLPARIVIAPGLAEDGSFAEVFTKGVELYAGYPDAEGNATQLGTLMPEVVDSDGVGHITSPAYLAVTEYSADALGGVFTYSSTKPFTVSVFRVAS
jgi:hypothetical protein